MKVLMFIFGIFLIPSSFAAYVTGPIKPETILHFHPELNAVGTNYRVPVVVGGVTGVAEIGADLTVGRLLANVAKGATGPWGAAAVTAAMLCYQETDWKICHSQIEPIVSLQIDTSQIIAATGTTSINYIYYLQGVYGYSFSNVCKNAGGVLGSDGWCRGPGFNASYATKYPCSGQHLNTSLYSQYCSNGDSTTNFSCSSGTLTNSSGAPMAVTGQYCTPESAYSCPTNYARSDSYGNLGSGMFCSYQAPTLTAEQQANMMKPVLLQYYADQLFNKPDGSVNPDYFADAGTTFDPVATPSTMPMTWDDLKKYVEWVRGGTAQTTDPLAPHYITPSNYDYTNNYITNNDSAVTNSTNNSTSTTITPADATSSAAMTQSQYEASNKKTDDKLKTDVAAIPQPSVSGLLSPIDDFTTSVNDIKTAQVPTLTTPSAISYGSGTCWNPTIDSFNGSKISAGVYCDNYSQIAHPILYWSIWAGTFIYLWHFGRQTVSARV